MKIFAAALACLFSAAASAQDSYPSRSVRLLVGFTPGGSTDVGARVMAQRLSTLFGQAVVVENRAGADGHLATQAVADASPDGYMLLWGHVAQIVMPAVYKQHANFDPMRDLTPIAATVKVESALVVPAASGITTFKQLAALLQDKTQNKSYGTQGAGTPGHIFNAWLAAKAGAVNTVAIHYKGATNSEADFLAGRITFRFDTPTTIRRLGAKINCLATLTEKRIPEAPDCPTSGEVGLPLDVDWTLWNSVHAPARMPKPLVDRIYAAVARILADPEFAKATEKVGITPLIGYTPEKTRALQEQQIKDWGDTVRKLGITLE